MSADVVEQSKLPAGWAKTNLGRERHRELCELIVAHGCDPDVTAWVAYDVADTPLLQVGLYQHDGKGGIRAWMVDGELRPVIKTVEVALRGQLPAWWQPRPPAPG